MAFQMKVSKDKIEGQDVVPPGEYELRLIGFKPTTAKSGTSFNLNPQFEIVNHPEFAGRKVYDVLNSGGAWVWADFCHALGLPMETDGKEDWLPGDFVGGGNPEDPKTWKYNGPLVGRVAKVELVVDNYNGRDNNKINRYFCAVPDCSAKFPKIRHQISLIKK